MLLKFDTPIFPVNNQPCNHVHVGRVATPGFKVVICADCILDTNVGSSSEQKTSNWTCAVQYERLLRLPRTRICCQWTNLANMHQRCQCNFKLPLVHGLTTVGMCQSCSGLFGVFGCKGGYPLGQAVFWVQVQFMFDHYLIMQSCHQAWTQTWLPG